MSAATTAIVTTAIAAGGSVLGAHMASSAAKKGADLQKQASDAALAYEKERDAYARSTEANRYGAMMRGTAPYRRAGAAATGEMSQLLGLPADTPDPVGSYEPPPEPATPSAPPKAMENLGRSAMAVGRAAGAQTQTGPSESTVRLQAPDGTVQEIPARQAEHYLQRGARRVK